MIPYKLYKNSNNPALGIDFDTRLNLEKIHESLANSITVSEPSSKEISRMKKLIDSVEGKFSLALEAERTKTTQQEKTQGNFLNFYSSKFLHGLNNSIGKSAAGNITGVASVMALDQARQYGADTALGMYYIASNIDTYKVINNLASSAISLVYDSSKFVGKKICNGLDNQCEKFADNLYGKAKSFLNRCQEKATSLLSILLVS